MGECKGMRECLRGNEKKKHKREQMSEPNKIEKR